MSMYLERLFELIRKEEVVIWAGAGMSMYAGYPSGNELAKKIYSSLTSPEKEVVSPNLLLPDLAEEYNRLRLGNNSLIRLIKNIIGSHSPLSTKYHDIIASIPHFKTIITTNYDSLFEIAYSNNGQKVISKHDIPYLEQNKTHIFKVHGDLNEFDNLILSKSDYINFFNKEKDSVYWSTIIERIATKTILFLGYNLEDPNITSIFNTVYENLKGHMKEAFLIVPGLPPHKISDLNRRGVHYIDSTAEVFLDKLIDNIKENIFSDFGKGWLTPDTYRKFLDLNNLIPVIKADKDKYILHSIESKNGEFEGKISLTFKNDVGFLSDFNNFINGENLGDLIIPEEVLIKSNFTVQGIRLPFSDGLKKIELKRQPFKIGRFDISFEDGFELIDLPFEIYRGKKPNVVVKFKNSKFRIFFDLMGFPDVDFAFEFSHDDSYGKLKEEIEVHSLLLRLSNGVKFSVYFDSKLYFVNQFSYNEKVVKRASDYLHYFEMLRKVEAHYSIKFNDFTITDESYHLLSKVVSIIDEKWEVFSHDGYVNIKLISNSLEVIDALKKIEEDKIPIVYPESDFEEVELHGHSVNLGYPEFSFLNPYISNFPRIISGDDDFAIIKSKSNEIQVSYSKAKMTK